MKVLCAIPCRRPPDMRPEVMRAVLYQELPDGIDLDIAIFPNRPPESPEPGVNEAWNLNRASMVAIEADYDYLWIVEADVVPPRYAVWNLTEASLFTYVTTGVYHYRQEARPDMMFRFSILSEANQQPPGHKQALEQGKTVQLFPPGEAGYCCIMVPRSVFIEVPFPLTPNTDVEWYQELHKRRIGIFCLGSVFCRHLERKEGGEKDWIHSVF